MQLKNSKPYHLIKNYKVMIMINEIIKIIQKYKSNDSYIWLVYF